MKSVQSTIIIIVSLFLLASCAAPIAQFQYPTQKRQAPAKVAFENQSKKAETYEWDFGDGNTSTETAPSHEYKKSGTYTITLKAKKGDKENVTTQTILIEQKPLTIGFKAQMDDKENPTEVSFNNTSTGGGTYHWDFGDNTTSKEKSPIHKYRFSGDYTVKLTVKRGAEQKEMTKKVVIDAPNVECVVELETNYGAMTIKLYNETPKHRDNFIKLVEAGFYNGLLFHRVINQFMIQGGDPNSKNAKKNTFLGSGGPGYLVDAEFHPDLIHIKGALAAARTNNPAKRSSGSQFYIVQGRPVTGIELNRIERRKGIKYTKEQRELYQKVGGTPHLDQEYTVFGQVVKGFEVIDKIARLKGNAQNRPMQDVTMKIRFIE